MKPARSLLLAAMVATSFLGSTAVIAPAAWSVEERAGDDYPYKGQSGTDKWGFSKRYCTSFVAHRLSQHGVNFKHAKYKGEKFGNANTWDEAARRAGIKVNGTPKVGSVAVWNSGGGGAGHVAYVSKVSGNKITVEEYHYRNHLAYGKRTIDKSVPSTFIHF
ncbi:CHAP domain-containing protein [Allokutzneria oryzae]|uniref:CHAP domain-containing protein n=1 Tax=Allokutzneria oryzae TaxID=1378989 RepID=A0ABV5ZWG9_9PSEU